MADLIGKSTIVEAKIKKLITLQSSLKAEVAALISENKHLKQTIREQQEQFRQQEEGNKTMKIASAIITNSKEDVPMMKATINELIRDIDKCLALLNK